MLKWLLLLRGVAVQASTPVSVMRRRCRLKPLEHLRQLPFEQLEFGDLPLNGAQLLRHKCAQSRTHGQTLSTVKLSHQLFEIGEREP